MYAKQTVTVTVANRSGMRPIPLDVYLQQK